jgi:oxalate decarboxylase/phosphoglucose isomerase-like protein (cupin superfamily)
MEDKRDPVEVAPDVYTVLFENDRVRVLQITMNVGARSAMHWHPDSVNYVLAGGEAAMTLPDASTMEMKVEPGGVVWQPAGDHAVVNTGASEVKVIAVELK